MPNALAAAACGPLVLDSLSSGTAVANQLRRATTQQASSEPRADPDCTEPACHRSRWQTL